MNTCKIHRRNKGETSRYDADETFIVLQLAWEAGLQSPKKRWVVATSAAAVAALALSGCAGGAGGGSDSATSYSTDTINTLLNTDPSGFDPAKAHAADDYTVSRMLYDSLLRKDADNKLVGGLATDWTAKSATDFEFTIRTDATCADGTKITPSVVADSLTYFASPEAASTFKSLVFGAGTPTFKADDSAGTLEITLDQPWSEVPTGLTLAQSGIICPAGLADKDGLLAGTVKGAFSGPYTLESATPGVNYKLALRSDYDAWPKFSTPLTGIPATTINYGVAKDTTTTANQLQSGDLDIAAITDNNATRFSDSSDYSITAVDLAGTYIVFNEREGSPFADDAGGVKLRTAVAQAISREAFNQATTDGRGTLYTTVASNEFACALDDESLLQTQDKDAAAKVLNGVSMRLAGTVIMGPQGAGNQYVQQALEEAGADVTLYNEDNPTWATRTLKQPDTWDLTVMGDINATGTMAASLTRVLGPTVQDGGRNIGGAVNPEGVADLTDALAATSDDAKCAAYESSQKTVLQRVDVVPLAGLLSSYIQRSGFAVSSFSGYLDPSSMRITG